MYLKNIYIFVLSHKSRVNQVVARSQGRAEDSRVEGGKVEGGRIRNHGGRYRPKARRSIPHTRF